MRVKGPIENKDFQKKTPLARPLTLFFFMKTYIFSREYGIAPARTPPPLDCFFAALILIGQESLQERRPRTTPQEVSAHLGSPTSRNRTNQRE
jgi:hypothetical protein